MPTQGAAAHLIAHLSAWFHLRCLPHLRNLLALPMLPQVFICMLPHKSPLLLEGRFLPKSVIPVDVDTIRAPGQFSFERVVH